MRFVEEAGPQWLGFAFTGTEFSGQLVETAEATPFWCAIEEIPYQRMWPDDAIWLPKILAQPPSSEADVYVADYLFNDGSLLEHQDSSDASIWQALTWS